MDEHSNDYEQRLAALRLEIAEGLRCATAKQLEDIKDLLGQYSARQLDEAIEKAEHEKGYTADTYKRWGELNAKG